MKDDSDVEIDDSDFEIDEKAAAVVSGPSELQFDEIEGLKVWGLMDADGNWVPEGTKLPPYTKKSDLPGRTGLPHIVSK